MTSHLHYHVNELLVKKGDYKTEQEARKHLERLGYKVNKEHTSITDNYYKYRQNRPHPDDYQMYTAGKNNAVYEYRHKNQKVIGKDPLHHLNHESLKQPLLKQRISALNPQIRQGANMVQQAREKRFLGKDGAGTWKYQYMKETYDKMRNPTQELKTEMTPANKQQQPVEMERLRYEMPIEPMKASAISKKYF